MIDQMPRERCNARLRLKGGIRCRSWPLKGKKRCRLHGGRNRGAGGMPIEWQREHVRLMVQRRLERNANMRLLKQAGMTWCITYNGKRWAHLASRMRLNTIQAARNLVMEQIKNLPAATKKPWEEQDDGEKLRTLTGLALDQKLNLLSMTVEIDENGKPASVADHKLLALQDAAGTGILALQVKIDESALREGKPDRLAEIIRRINDARTTIIGQPLAPFIEHKTAAKKPKKRPATEWGDLVPKG